MSNAQKAQDFVTSFMKNLAEGVELTSSLQAVFAKILAEQVVVDADSVVNFKPAFSTLLKVLTFIATPEDKRPEAGSSYTQEAIDTAADSAANENGLTVGEISTEEPTEEPTDGPTDEPTEEPTDGPTDEPTEEPGIEGNTLELTTGADVIAPLAEGEEAVEGVQYTTENDDVINGLAGTYATTTLQKNDQIDGGAGNDTLNVELTSKFGGFTGDGFLKNVETVNLANDGTSTRLFDAANVEGVETYNLDGLVDLGKLATTDAAVNVANRASGTVKIGYGEKVTDGEADVLNLGVTNVGTAEVKDAKGKVTTKEELVKVEALGIETLNLTAVGANLVDLSTADKANTINATGEGSLKLRNLTKEVKDIDASGLAGNLNLDLGTAVKDVNSIKGGAGDDLITANKDNLKVNTKIDGGEGSDTLVLSDITNTAATTLQLDMVGVETIKLADSAKDLTYSAAKTLGLENLEVTGAIGGAALFASLEGDLNVTLNGATSSGSVSADNDGATTLKITGLGTKDVAATNSTSLSFSKTASLDVTIDAYNGFDSGSISAAAAEAASLTLNGNIGKSTAATTLALASAESLVINDNNKSKDQLTLQADKLQELTINVNGAANPAAVDFTLVSGAAATSLKGLKALNIKTDGVVEAKSALEQIADITLNGMGSVELGNLGAAAAEDSITLTAVGLAGTATVAGLKTGAINTSDGNSVDIDVSEVLGEVELGDITVAAKDAKATGSITITAEGTAKDISLGTLTAQTVTIDAGEALGSITQSGGVAADANNVKIIADEANFTGSGVGGNAVHVTAAKATISGGITDDFITIKGVAAGTDVVATATLTGGLGVDTFRIDSTSVTASAKMIVTITDFNAGEDILQIGNATGTAFTANAGITMSGSTVLAKLETTNSNRDSFTASSISDKAAGSGTAGDGVITLLSGNTAATTAQKAFFDQFNAFDSTLNFTASNTKLAKVDINGSTGGTAGVVGLMNNGDFYTFNALATAASSVLVKLVGVTAIESYDFVFAVDAS